MNLRTVVVDDEMPARNRLRKFLSEEPGLEIVAECASGPEAIQCIQRQQPDLVFLDVQMPEVNGLEVARALPAEHFPAIVFVTAFDRHAVEAFEVRAMDYLLKPFSRMRLQESLRRVRERLQTSASAQAVQTIPKEPSTQNNPPHLNRFAIKDGNQTIFVRTQDVDYIEAAANYVVLCTPNGNHVLRESLRNLESVLSPAMFFRISRSIIVNMDRIKAIRVVAPGDCLVVLEGERELEMTRGLKEVQERLLYSSIHSSPDPL